MYCVEPSTFEIICTVVGAIAIGAAPGWFITVMIKRIEGD